MQPNQKPEYNCPYRDGSSYLYKQLANKYLVLEYVIIGSLERQIRLLLNKKRKDQIINRLWQKQYSDLCTELQEKGQQLLLNLLKGRVPKDGNSGSSVVNNTIKTGRNKSRVPTAYFLGNINACIIDPTLLLELGEGIYTTLNFLAYLFLDSTLLNNYRAIYLVNSKEMLVPGLFRKLGVTDFVDTGTQSILIISRGLRVIKNYLVGEKGPNTQDLVLSNVVVIEGFYINIVSEALLLKAGLWFSRKDYTLRQGELGNSIVIKQLERYINLVFFKYKHRSYSSIPLYILFTYTALMFLTISQ